MTKIAYVKWIDAESRRPQMSLKSLRNAEGLGVETAGLIVQNSRKTLVVVQDIFDDAEDYDDRDARMAEIIPKKYITAMRIFDTESGDAAH